jgi:hypothetical protein
MEWRPESEYKLIVSISLFFNAKGNTQVLQRVQQEYVCLRVVEEWWRVNVSIAEVYKSFVGFCVKTKHPLFEKEEEEEVVEQQQYPVIVRTIPSVFKPSVLPPFYIYTPLTVGDEPEHFSHLPIDQFPRDYCNKLNPHDRMRTWYISKIDEWNDLRRSAREMNDVTSAHARDRDAFWHLFYLLLVDEGKISRPMLKKIMCKVYVPKSTSYSEVAHKMIARFPLHQNRFKK